MERQYGTREGQAGDYEEKHGAESYYKSLRYMKPCNSHNNTLA